MIALSSDARLLEALADRVRRRCRKAVEIHVEGVHEVEVVVHELGGLAARHAVDELERPKPALEPLGVEIERSVSLETVICGSPVITDGARPRVGRVCRVRLRGAVWAQVGPSSSSRRDEIETLWPGSRSPRRANFLPDG